MTSHFYKLIFPQWILSIIALYVLVFQFQWIYVLYLLMGVYIPGIIGNTIGFHRYLTHQSFEVNKFWHYAFIVLGSMTGQGSPIFWTALHLHHHRHSDTDADVHSPIHGFFKSTILWQIRGTFNSMPGLIAPKKLYRDPFIKFLHYHYYKFYWVIGLLFAIVDIHFFLFFFCLGAFFMMSVIDNMSNYLMHSNAVGYASHRTRDNSRNVPLIAWFTLGAGWHNNHHNNPKSYRFGENKNEIDIGAAFIDLIKKKS